MSSYEQWKKWLLMRAAKEINEKGIMPEDVGIEERAEEGRTGGK